MTATGAVFTAAAATTVPLSTVARPIIHDPLVTSFTMAWNGRRAVSGGSAVPVALKIAKPAR